MINKLKNFYDHSIWHKVLFWIFMVLISFIFSLGLEYFIFNYRALKNPVVAVSSNDIKLIGTQNITVTDNGSLVINENEEAVATFSVPDAYIDSIDFYGKSDRAVPYRFSYLGDGTSESLLYPSFDNTEETIAVNARINEFTIEFINSKDAQISIEFTAVQTGLHLNGLRITLTAIIILLIFYSLTISFEVIPKKWENIALVFVLSIGIIMAIYVPFGYVWDEYQHFIRAYNVSYGNFILKDNEAILYPSNMESLIQVNYRSLTDYFRETSSISAQAALGLSERSIFSTAATYMPFAFLVSGLGILITRVLGMSIVGMYVGGRIANLLFYAVCVWVAIKHFPYNKRLLAFLVTLIQPLFLAASYSADMLLNSMVILGFSLLAEFCENKKELSILNYFLLALPLIVATQTKVSYAPIIFLLFLIPKDRYKNAWFSKCAWAITLLLFFIVAGTTYLYANKMGLALWPQPGINSQEQISNILSNPLHYFKVVWNYSIGTAFTPSYLSEIINQVGYIGRITASIATLVFIVIGILSITGETNKLCFDNRKSRFVILLTFILSYGLIITALYVTFTPVGNNGINGVQPRYFYSILLILLMTIQSKQFSLKKVEGKWIDNLTMFTTIIMASSFFQILIANYYR